jgi:photosystem II stability/assembly factor-like uncharacterized protein
MGFGYNASVVGVDALSAASARAAVLLVLVVVPLLAGAQGCKPAAHMMSELPDSGPDPTAMTWNSVVLPTPDAGLPPNLMSVWGSSVSDIYIVGEASTVYHLTGGSWVQETVTSTVDLLDVNGSGPDDVYAVGFAGTILHRSMGVWTAEKNAQKVTLRAVRARAGGLAFAVGDNGTILERGVAGWAPVPSDTEENLNGLWLSPDGSAGVAVGNLGTITVLSGNAWMRQRVTGLLSELKGVWGTDPNNLYIVGLDGTLLRSGSGGWDSIDGAPQVFLRGVYGTSMSDAYLVGWGGTLAHTDGTQVDAYPDPSGDHRLEAVWGGLLDPPTEPGPDGGVVPHARFYIVGVTGVALVGPRLEDQP